MTASQYTEWILSTLQEKQLNFMFKTLHSPWRKGGKCITHQWALLYTLTATKPVTLLQHSLHWFISAEEAWPHMNSSRCWGLLQRSWPVQLLYRYSYKQSWFYCGLPACSHWSQQCKRAKRYQLHSYPVSLLGHFHIMQLRTVETNAVISILLQSAPGTDQLTSTWSGRILLVPSWQPSLFLCCALQESLQINLPLYSKNLISLLIHFQDEWNGKPVTSYLFWFSPKSGETFIQANFLNKLLELHHVSALHP